MNSEQIIRLEAQNFVKNNYNLQKYYEAINLIHSIKERLSDFYTEESKSVFLDEIKSFLLEKLREHREEKQ